MRLNCILFSSFLFTSAVLAGYQPDQQQPPFLNRVEKSINSTTVIPLNNWAGAVSKKSTDFIAGTFTVPEAEGPIGSGFYIALSIGGVDNREIVFGAGITVKMAENDRATYEAWGQWYPEDVHTAPSSFLLSAGHEIGVVLQLLSPTSGVFVLINFTTGTPLGGFVSGSTSITEDDADWVMTVLPPGPDGTPTPLANFSTVIFTFIQVYNGGAYKYPDHASISTHDIVQNNQAVTAVQAYSDLVIIEYFP